MIVSYESTLLSTKAQLLNILDRLGVQNSELKFSFVVMFKVSILAYVYIYCFNMPYIIAFPFCVVAELPWWE